MKKILQLTKLALTIALVLFSIENIQACGLRGKIIVDTSICTSQGLAKLKLINHTTAAGTTYTWELSTDGGLSFNTMITNSGADTQNINPGLVGRMYRCRSTCVSGTVYSDTAVIFFMDRFIQVDKVRCSATAGGNDSIVLSAKTLTQATDTAYAKNFRWQSSTTNGIIWNNLSSNRDTIIVQFTPNIVQYRAYVSVCPLTGPISGYPTTTPQLINKVDIGLDKVGLVISDRDCLNDTARLSLTNLIPSLRSVLKYRWYDSSTVSGVYNNMTSRDSFIRVKVDSVNRFYKANIKLCEVPFPSKDSLVTNTYQMWVKLGAFSPTLNCLTQKVELDYTNRNLARNSVYLYWTRSQNDSISHTAFNVPVDSVAYEFDLLNKTKFYYKVFSKFCATSSKVLDSSKNVLVHLDIDTGQLKASIVACTNDSVYMKLLNYKDSSSFPLLKKWMYKPNGSTFFDVYTQSPLTDTTIAFRMSKGWNYYRKSVSLCSDKYSKQWSSTEASTFLPFELIDTISCTGNMTVRVMNDTVKIRDYTGTTNRSNSTFSYQWLKSTNNKLTSNLIPGANGATLTITSADKGSFFRRITKVCSAGSFQDTTNWSNLVFGNPNVLNGRAEVAQELCLNDTVSICVTNFTPKTGDTATYIWQVSNDDINWTSMLTNTSNDSCIRVVVTPTYKYFRRLTYWCPSGTVDSTISTPLIFIQKLPWCEGFTSQLITGKDVLFNCWRSAIPVCNSYNPVYAGSQLWSRTDVGKTTKGMSNWGPAASDPKNPPGRRADIKLITPAFYLERGKIYRFSFWHKETTANICWDSLYVTWGNKPTGCDITNKFGETLTKFSFDQYNKFWSDFVPQDDGIYYFGINLRDKDQTTGEVNFDDICLKEIESCKGKTPVKGATFAPSKIVDRVEDPSKAQTYDKDRVTHQYCIHDTIMLTYNETNYANNFDYYGMTYQFWKKRQDADWKIEDTFFRPIPSDTLCHIVNRTNYHVMNVLVTDTNTWYKIVATCQFDGKQYHSDSLIINGTHSVPYCEDWEGVGNINNQPSALPNKNSGEIVGKVPSFSFCPTCWASYPQNSPTNPTPANLSLYSATIPLRNIVGGVPQIPQLEPDAGWAGNDVVLNCDNNTPTLTRKVLVMPAMRLYKGRGYRISFRWADNRRTLQSPWGNASQDLDSLYVMIVKGNQSGKTVDSFSRNKMIPGSLKRDLQSNILESGSFKYRTYWADYMPPDTGTYYIGIAVVPGPGNGNPYRFMMDYFCVDTITVDDSCNTVPKFKDPLRIRISPDGKLWSPGDTSIFPIGSQWCVGNNVNIEVDFGFGSPNNWSYGWKMYWQRSTNRITPNWTTFDSFVPGVSMTNSISYQMTYKYKDFRLIFANKCNTKFDTVGPFKVLPAGGDIPWRENFDASLSIPPCWEVYSTCRTMIKDGKNEFNQGARSLDNFLDMDFITPATTNCPARTTNTAVPPGFGVTGGVTHRFSFWYKDNGISLPIDSIRAAWSYTRATDVANNVLINQVNGDIVRNSKTNKWRYYTAEFTPAVDTTYHIKVTTYNLGSKRIYRTLFDDFMLKFKQNIDAIVIAVDSSDVQCDLPANSNLKVTVMNIGSTTLPNIPVKVSVDNGTPVSFVVPGPIASNQTKIAYVPGIDLSSPGARKVRVWTDVPGEQDAYDDTFATEIIHNQLYPKPTDTVDSVCICSNYQYDEKSPNGQTRWYRNITDNTPFQIGDILKLDSVCKDTCLFRSTWNGGVCYTTPPNFSFGAPAYSAAAGGLTFDNISKDTILIDSVMIYANTLSTVPFNITISQFTGAQQVTRAVVGPLSISKLGRQWLPIKVKIPPGTDYRMTYPGGTASLATLPNFIYIGSGCPSFELNIVGDDGFPAAPTAYKYFFNWRLVRIGCESEKVKMCFKTVASPKFKIKDTGRVCSRPIYQVCGPDAPVGSTYTYNWHTSTTNKCEQAIQTGWYKLTVTNEFGCKENDSVQITVDPSPIFNLGPDTSFCRYSPHTINTGLDSASNVVTWSDNQSGVKINVLNPGTYVATAYNIANFCTAMDTVVVTRRELPVFSLGNDRVFCGTSADLQALAPNLPNTNTYVWSAGPVITTLGKNKYWVVGTDPFGCKNTDTIEANLVAKPVFDLGADRDVCGSSTTLDGPIGKYYYLWNTTSTKRSILVSTPGTYYLTVTDSVFGCQSVDSIKVKFKTVPVFDLGADVVKCALTHIINGPTTTGLNYRWERPKGVNRGSGASFIADTTGVYYLIVDNNCYTYSDSVRITLKTPAQNAIDMLKDTFGCNQVPLRATSRVDYTKLQWGFPLTDTSNTIMVKKTGTYSVALTNECGTATKSVQVRVDSTPTANFKVATYPDCMSVALTNLSTNGVTYQWQFGDNTSDTVENPLHLYSVEGDYLVTLKTYNSCGFAAKTLPIARRQLGCKSGINSTTLEEAQLYVFPNPTKNSTQLMGVGLPNGQYNVTIKNLLGQSVYEDQVKINDNQIDLRLDVSKFASGEYLVTVSNDTETIVKKLQIMK